jgi:hypothetical protein
VERAAASRQWRDTAAACRAISLSRWWRSKIHERGNQRVGSFEPSPAQLGRNDRFHRFQLFGRVHAQVNFRGPALTGPARGGRDNFKPVVLSEFQAAVDTCHQRRCAGVLLQNIFESGSGQRHPFGIDEQLGHTNRSPHRQPSPQVGRGFLPEGKASLLAALALDEKARRPLQR